MAKLTNSPWNPQFIFHSPMFEPLLGFAHKLAAFKDGWPSLNDYQDLLTQHPEPILTLFTRHEEDLTFIVSLSLMSMDKEDARMQSLERLHESSYRSPPSRRRTRCAITLQPGVTSSFLSGDRDLTKKIDNTDGAVFHFRLPLRKSPEIT